jgi:hypothetical protein
MQKISVSPGGSAPLGDRIYWIAKRIMEGFWPDNEKAGAVLGSKEVGAGAKRYYKNKKLRK